MISCNLSCTVSVSLTWNWSGDICWIVLSAVCKIAIMAWYRSTVLYCTVHPPEQRSVIVAIIVVTMINWYSCQLFESLIVFQKCKYKSITTDNGHNCTALFHGGYTTASWYNGVSWHLELHSGRSHA